MRICWELKEGSANRVYRTGKGRKNKGREGDRRGEKGQRGEGRRKGKQMGTDALHPTFCMAFIPIREFLEKSNFDDRT